MNERSFLCKQKHIFFVQDVPEFQSQFLSMDHFESKPLNGVKVGIIRETLEDGVDSGVRSATQEAASHLEALGCVLTEVFFINSFVSVFLFRFVCSLSF